MVSCIAASLALNTLVFVFIPCESAASPISVFTASHAVYVFPLEVSWHRFLAFSWRLTQRETDRETKREREIVRGDLN